MKYIAIIPARSGSKGIIDKNIQHVGKKTLLQRAIESAKCKEISQIYVSTDSNRYIKSCQEYECIFHKRKDELATDAATTLSVLEDLVEEFDLKKEDIRIVLL